MSPELSMAQKGTTIPHTQVVLGHVGVCGTNYEVSSDLPEFSRGSRAKYALIG